MRSIVHENQNNIFTRQFTLSKTIYKLKVFSSNTTESLSMVKEEEYV